MTEIRSPTEGELDAVFATTEAAFGDVPDESWHEAARKTMPLDRILAAFDGGRPVGVAAACPLELAIPGGTLPTAGLTWVSVLPSHRRRGLLRELIGRIHDDARERGEPLAALFASESAIYGRFGYGIAAPMHSIDADRAGFAFRDDPGPQGAIRLVTVDEAVEAFPPVYDRVRASTPGLIGRSEPWWREFRLSGHEAAKYGPKFLAVLELDGEVAGYVIYRNKGDWSDDGLPQGRVTVVELVGESPAAARELWRFVFSIDLVVRVKSDAVDPATPLILQVVDPRRLRLSVSDGLWLRFLDVDAALRARSYEVGEPVVLEVRDEGSWRVGERVERVDAEADLSLDARDLASLYLGAFTVDQLVRAGRVEARGPEAVERASALFRTPRPPHCPEEF